MGPALLDTTDDDNRIPSAEDEVLRVEPALQILCGKYSMRIKDIIDEAISVTQYEGPLVTAITRAVYKAVAELVKLKGQHPSEEAELESDEGNGKAFKLLVIKQLRDTLRTSLPAAIMQSLNKSMGVPVITEIAFEEMNDQTGGYAQERYIALNERYLRSIVARLVEKMIDSVYSSYNPGERVSGFAFMARMADGNSHEWSILHGSIDKTIARLASISLHELVHVLQHNQQEIAGRDTTEYRSYLDKYNGEFRKTVDDETNALSSTTSDRQWNLYLASPQEITAFAHEIALQVVRDYGYDQATTVEELSGLDARDIADAVNKKLSGRFSKPTTPKEVMVRKRYLKLVYQEIIRYIEHRLSSFKK